MSNSFLQPLEDRLLFSVAWDANTTIFGDASISLRKGILIVQGGDGDDRIRFSSSARFGKSPFVFPLPGPIDSKLIVKINGHSASFSFNDIKQIRIEGGGGDDDIQVLPVPPLPTCPTGGVWEYPFGPISFGWQDKPTIILGGDGNDTIVGGDLNDTLSGGAGNDLIYGRSGDDRILGNSGNDEILGNEGDDYIDAGAGDDKVFGTSDHFRLHYDDADTLVGGDGNDELHGESGDDLLLGGSGDDQLWGDEGSDQGRGGAGRDGGNKIEKRRDKIEIALPDPFWGTTCV